MNWYLLGAFIIASLVLLATPGPNLLAVIGRGIGQGHRAALVAVMGYALGDILNTACAILGLSALIRSSAALFQLVKYVGAVYLIFLGVQAICHKQHLVTRQHHENSQTRHYSSTKHCCECLKPQDRIILSRLFAAVR